MRHIWLHVCFFLSFLIFSLKVCVEDGDVSEHGTRQRRRGVLLNVDGRRRPVCWDADASLPRQQLRRQAQDAESRQTLKENPRRAVGLVSGGKTLALTDSSIHKHSLTSVSSDSLCWCLPGSRTSHGTLLIYRFTL